MTSNIPNGATHIHSGCDRFISHFIKVDGDVVYTWLTGMIGGDCWSDIPAHDDLSNYTELMENNND